jgi:hypothetical protein
MALLFDTTGEFVSHGTAANLDDIFKGTAWAWFWFDTIPSVSAHAHRILSKGTNWFPLGTQATDILQCTIARATLAQLAFAPFANFAAGVTTGKWIFIAATWDTGGAATDQKIYVGDLDTLAAEPSSYTTQRVGTGAVTSNATANCYAGNTEGATAQRLDGRLAHLGLVSGTLLTLGQIHTQQFRRHPIANTVLFCEYGYNGTGTQPDWSGSANSGAVTGATVIDHVPIPFRRTRDLWVPTTAVATGKPWHYYAQQMSA